jgi:hypothetical protein
MARLSLFIVRTIVVDGVAMQDGKMPMGNGRGFRGVAAIVVSGL